MAKIKVKKQSTFIDMTAMSDVTVLLLTFFMLTSTFVKKEPIQVTTPSSVSEIKIPETNLLTILVDANGKIFMSLSNDDDKINTLKNVGAQYGIEFTPAQIQSFKTLQSFGVPITMMKSFLDLPTDKQDEYMRDVNNTRVGIPTGDGETKDNLGVVSKDNEFKNWILYAVDNNKKLQIAIKSDKNTDYPVVKKVMDDLRSKELKQNRYLLITSLKTASAESGAK